MTMLVVPAAAALPCESCNAVRAAGRDEVPAADARKGANPERRIPVLAVPFAYLAALAALSPLTIDMIVPTLGAISATQPGTKPPVGLMLTLWSVGSAIAQVFCGPLSDRFGRRPIVLAGCLLVAVANLGCALAAGLAALLLWRFVCGVGGGMCLFVTFAIVRDVNTGSAIPATLARVTAAMWVGSVVAPPLAGALMVLSDWRAVFGALAAASCLLLAAVTVDLPETQRRLPAHQRLLRGPMLAGYGQVLGTRAVLVSAGIGAMAFSVLFSLGAASATLLHTAALGPLRSAMLYGLITGGMSGGGLLSRLLIERGCASTTILGFGAAGLLVATLALAAVELSGHGGLAMTAGLLIATTLAVGVIVPNAIAGGLAPLPSLAGTASAVLGVARMLAASVASAIVALTGHSAMAAVTVMVGSASLAALIHWAPARQRAMSAHAAFAPASAVTRLNPDSTKG